eukprot:691467-Prymnesium_polylepis.1
MAGKLLHSDEDALNGRHQRSEKHHGGKGEGWHVLHHGDEAAIASEIEDETQPELQRQPAEAEREPAEQTMIEVTAQLRGAAVQHKRRE